MDLTDQSILTPYPRWIIDDTSGDRFPIWTRGNAGEVFPNVLSPLGGSIYGEAPVRGHRRSFVELGLFTKDEVERDNIAMSGVFGGYLFLNLSAGRLMGVRTPGMTVELVDEQGYGVSDAPPYRRHKGDRDFRASLRISRWAAKAMWKPDLAKFGAAQRRAKEWVSTFPDIASATDAQLLALIPGFTDRIEAFFLPVAESTALAGLGRAMLEQLLRKRTADDPPLLVNRMASWQGRFDGAEPARHAVY